jgi:hypothetical protein
MGQEEVEEHREAMVYKVEGMGMVLVAGRGL